MSKPTRVYICGPMTGLPALDTPAFVDAAAQLRAQGFDVVSPVELNPNQPTDIEHMSPAWQEHNWRQCMRRDIAAMVGCDVIVMLPNWSRSRGALVEVTLAESLGIPCWALAEFLAKSERRAA